MDKQDKICFAVVILVILVVALVIGYSWYIESTKKPKERKDDRLIISEGDLITCDFTEYIYTRDSNGVMTFCVYQTTLESIAENDSIPKCVTFEQILVNNSGSIIGERLTAIVGNDLSTEITPGFNSLVLDMKEGETKIKEVPLSEGYGARNKSLIVTIPFLDSIPLYETYDRADFESRYSDELPLQPGKSFPDHYWNWTIRVDSITEDSIVIKHEPEINMELDVFKWPAKVANVSSSSGKIWIRHSQDTSLVNTPLDIERLEFYKPMFSEIKYLITETQQPYPGIIISVQDSIEIDFNRENIGKNLKYEVTIIKIERD